MANIVVEYAKSNRSSCKICSNTISTQSLRLGVVTRDPQGFSKTMWHHVDCFPREPHSIVSVQEIQGFFTLKVCDQEFLKKLELVPINLLTEACSGDDKAAEESAQTNLSKRKKPETAVEADLKITISASDAKNKKPLTVGTVDVEITFSASDAKNKYKDAALFPKWKAFQTLIFLEKDDGLYDSKKIAAFDFDGSLVRTSLNRVGPDAWSLLYPSIPEKLQTLYRNGYKLVIFTNESNIERWQNKRQVAVNSKIGRLNNFIKLVKVPIQVFIACGLSKVKNQNDDPFRKPKPGMWRIMVKHFNSGLPVDMTESFYVGDAAGRANDHSDADIKFAEAIGLKFYSPEDYFCT